MGSQQQKFYPSKSPQYYKFITNNVVLWISFVFIILSFVGNFMMRHHLYKFGNQIIIHMQSYQTPFLDILFNGFTLLVDNKFSIIILTLTFTLSSNKIRILPLHLYILFNSYLSTVIKGLYQDSRPFWINSNIHHLGINCSKQFGNPSGHSWLGIVILFLYSFEVFNMGKYCVNLILTSLICILIMISRMYLGAHSLNQVLQGFFLGITSIIFYRYLIQGLLLKTIRYFLNMRKNIKVNKVIYQNCGYLQLFLFIFSILVYSLTDTYRFNEIETQNIMKQCSNINTTQLHKFNKYILLTSSIVHMAFGSLYGLTVANQYNRYYFGRWKYIVLPKQLKIQKIFLKIMVELSSFVIPFIISYMASFWSDNIYINYVFLCLGFTIGSYCYMGLTPFVLIKRKVIELY